jgi:thiol-disulfide isomerase/thioredoxin
MSSFSYVDQVLGSGMPDFPPSFEFGDPALDRGITGRRGSRGSRKSYEAAAKAYDRTWLWVLGVSLSLAVIVIIIYVVISKRRKAKNEEREAAQARQAQDPRNGGGDGGDNGAASYEARRAAWERQQQAMAAQQQRQVRFADDASSAVGSMRGATGVTGYGGNASQRSAVPRVIGDFSNQAPVVLQNGDNQNRSNNGKYGGDGIVAETARGADMLQSRYNPQQAPPQQQRTQAPPPAAASDGDPLGGMGFYGGSGGAGMGVGASPMQFVSLGDDTQQQLNASLGASLNDDGMTPQNASSGGAAPSVSSAVREIADMATWEKFCGQERFKGVLMVYSDNCGHCVTLKPVYEEAARALSNVMPFYRMNSQAAMPMLQRLGVQGVPFVAAFRGDSFSQYQGNRTLNDLVQWARVSA